MQALQLTTPEATTPTAAKPRRSAPRRRAPAAAKKSPTKAQAKVRAESSGKVAMADAEPAQAENAATAAPAGKEGKPGTEHKKAVKPGHQADAEKSGKHAKRPTLVRDSFTMPESDFALIAELKHRAMAAMRETKKSELLRAGLRALAALETPALLAALGALEPVKVGRPKHRR